MYFSASATVQPSVKNNIIIFVADVADVLGQTAAGRLRHFVSAQDRPIFTATRSRSGAPGKVAAKAAVIASFRRTAARAASACGTSSTISSCGAATGPPSIPASNKAASIVASASMKASAQAPWIGRLRHWV